MTVLKPFNNAAVDFDIASKDCSADTNSGVAKIGPAVVVRSARIKDFNGSTLGCYEVKSPKSLVTPDVVKD